MSELVSLLFETKEDALSAKVEFSRMQSEHLVELEDLAVVHKGPRGRVRIDQTVDLAAAGAASGGFWGLLVGLLFAAPWMGLAIGAAAGAAIGRLTDYGVDDKFIKDVADTVQPGHSALFLLIHMGDLQRWLDELKGFSPKVLQTTLSSEEEAKLREAFGGEE